MASVSKRVRNGKTTWRVRWRDDAGDQKNRSFAKKYDADRFKTDVENSLNVGSYIDPKTRKITFREFAEQWRAAQPHRANTATRVEYQLRLHAYPAFGNRPIGAIRPSEIQAWVTGLPMAPGSVKVVYSTVRAVFRAAQHDRIITHLPTDKIKLPTIPREQVDPLTVAQVEALVGALPERYQALGIVAAGSGLRLGELTGLRVGDIDFFRKTIKVERQLHARGEIGPPKNEASRRTVPIGNVVVAALAEHLRRWPVDRDGFVFQGPSGGALLRSNLMASVWRPAVRRAGLSGVGMHALRHFYASALIFSGLSVTAVAARLGHSSPTETLDTYGHLWPSDEDRTRQAVDSLFQRQDQEVPARPTGVR